jgi:Tetrapyrrole (Corrin/Porphyrin) Methylases
VGWSEVLRVLYVVATLIGNLGDLAERARKVLTDVDLIAAEDTRQTRRLLAHCGISTPLVSYHEHNESGAAAARLIAMLDSGKDLALVSDAGTPASVTRLLGLSQIAIKSPQSPLNRINARPRTGANCFGFRVSKGNWKGNGQGHFWGTAQTALGGERRGWAERLWRRRHRYGIGSIAAITVSWGKPGDEPLTNKLATDKYAFFFQRMGCHSLARRMRYSQSSEQAGRTPYRPDPRPPP